ncbi:uncharacterized protein LOC9644566 [Selaginella moellendorffii]|uniref:uncharacterized protein LOC9644566 n=1 Tax=Selaginella moellendorffii TaxID=88036 RepID=UPI000D1CC765|nr:uncharacterized protein LOC9644566 [Selaginella moellendorffii]|eukprot:XP_024544890.1 uncharacterized protein LOC9644566 [Selaginella moellendorffii]
MIAVQGVYRLACQAAMQRQSQDEIQKLSCIGVHQNLACTASGMEHVATLACLARDHTSGSHPSWLRRLILLRSCALRNLLTTNYNRPATASMKERHFSEA